MLNSRYYILYVLLFIFSCDELITIHPSDQSPSTTLIDTIDSIINHSFFNVIIQGNEVVSSIKYNVDMVKWTDWMNVDTSNQQLHVQLMYLDEGEHSFSYKGKSIYEDVEEDSTHTVFFTVDAVQGPGIRIYPLLNHVGFNDIIYVDIYAEEVENLVAAAFQLKYDPNHLTIDTEQVSLGTLFANIEPYIFIVEEIDSGIIEINFSLLSHEGVSGTGPLFSIPLSSAALEGYLLTSLEILNPEFSDINGNSIEVIDSANGTVIIE